MKKDRKGNLKGVGRPEIKKGKEKEAAPSLLSLLPSLEDGRVILTVPLGKGKGDEGEA